MVKVKKKNTHREKKGNAKNTNKQTKIDADRHGSRMKRLIMYDHAMHRKQQLQQERQKEIEKHPINLYKHTVVSRTTRKKSYTHGGPTCTPHSYQ
jgi:hypothetical protein